MNRNFILFNFKIIQNEWILLTFTNIIEANLIGIIGNGLSIITPGHFKFKEFEY